jgi:hypothetical protein
MSLAMVSEGFRNKSPGDEGAQALAIEALGQLAGDQEKLLGFLAISGIEPQNLRTSATAPAFLQGVLDYVCNDETLLREIAANIGRSPEDIDRARMILAGPPPDWGA